MFSTSANILEKKIPNVKLRIVGPAEEDYKRELYQLSKELGLEKNIEFLPAVFDIHKKITTIDKSRVFVLPSKREAMPISLIEVLARKKIALASDNKGSSEIIANKINGFIYPKEDARKLAELILYSLDKKNNKQLKLIQAQARKTSLNFKWEDISTSFLSLISSLVNNKQLES